MPFQKTVNTYIFRKNVWMSVFSHNLYQYWVLLKLFCQYDRLKIVYLFNLPLIWVKSLTTVFSFCEYFIFFMCFYIRFIVCLFLYDTFWFLFAVQIFFNIVYKNIPLNQQFHTRKFIQQMTSYSFSIVIAFEFWKHLSSWYENVKNV